MHLSPVLSLGIIFLTGFFAFKIVGKVRLPTVTGYLILGIIIGEEFLNLVSDKVLSSSSFVSSIVLGFVAFTLGQNFSLQRFKRIGKTVILISIFESVCAWFIVTFAFYFILRQSFYVSIIFGAIASATAPAATVMVVRESGAKGLFTNILLGIVAIDDAWCLIIFSLSLAIAKVFVMRGSSGLAIVLEAVGRGVLEVGGAFALGISLGFLFKILSKLVKTEQGLEIYTLGFIFLAIGIAEHLHVSVLLSSMVLGATVVNTLKGDNRFFQVIKGLEYPLYLLFFVLAGANLELESLKHLGIFSVVYLFARVLGKVLGARLGALLGRAPKNIQKYVGFGLIPQAGVALGVALIAKSDFPAYGAIIFDTIVSTTVLYEIFGPIVTKWALLKAGDISLSHEASGA
ncbi:MAG: cation:proton antiporter [bacterium]|nr:cation:proton antiporter [bacterium]